MNNIHNIDQPSKKLISKAYRIILILFSLLLLVKNWNQLAVIVFSIPFIYYFLFDLVIKKLSGFIRLVYDYFFILIILTIVHEESLLGMIFFLIPFINSPNHQENKKNVASLFYVSFLAYTIIESVNAKQVIFDFYAFVALGLVTIIIFFEHLRSVFSNKILDSYREIDQINFEKSRSSNIPSTYHKVISLLNSKILPTFFISYKVKYISSFVIRNNQLSILNSSKFFTGIHTTQENIEKIKSYAKKEKTLQKIPIEIQNHGISDNNILIYFQYKMSFIYFVLFFDDKFDKSSLFLLIVVNNYLKPLFKKVLQTIKFEEHIKSTQLENMKKLLSDMKYVSTTNKSLHTINNEFTPIKNYFKMIKETNKFDEEKRDIVLKKIEKQAPQAVKSFDRI